MEGKQSNFGFFLWVNTWIALCCTAGPAHTAPGVILCNWR